MYKLIRPLVFRQDAEQAHGAMQKLGILASRFKLHKAFSLLYSFEHPSLKTEVFGLSFLNPIGLAAGFLKNAQLLNFMSSLGFGFVEIGTITPKPQEGNPKPRIFRLAKDQALLNRLGFHNEGMIRLKEQLEARKSRDDRVVGVSIGKNKDTPNAKALFDYVQCFNVLSGFADYVVINVSSPNTPGLRELQEQSSLRNLLQRLQELNKKQQKPILVKIAPDLTEDQLNGIVKIVQETGISGIIATNTTIARHGLKTSPRKLQAMGKGGLSGKPLQKRSTAVIRFIYEKSQGKIPIIGVGGIFSAEDAYEKIRAGASLVQLYTGLVYEGPGLIKHIKQGLVQLLLRDGFFSIGQAVGKG